MSAIENAIKGLFEFLIEKPWTLFVSSIVWYFFNRRKKKRELKTLNEQLIVARAAVGQLQHQIDEIEAAPDDGSDSDEQKPIRIFMDGAFDIMHFGHMNAFRQGRALGTHLVVGINSDDSITTCKGTAPVMKDDERCTAVSGCRFVDEIVPDVPYVMTSEYLEWVVKEYNIDYVVHGDDPCIVDGKDVYASAKERNMYRSVARTEGVSTSDIVGRMLLLTKDHHDTLDFGEDGPGRLSDASAEPLAPFKRDSKYIPTSRMIRLFSSGIQDPPKDATVIYMDGAWDMFHAGHIDVLKKAKALAPNSYLIVGVHNDELVNNHRGSNFPTMNLHERVLSVLGCRHVDDVVIDAPWEVTEELIKSLNISVVARGTTHDPASSNIDDCHNLVAKKMKIYKEIQSSSKLCISEIRDRINDNAEFQKARFEKKAKAEQEFFQAKRAAGLGNDEVKN